MAGQKYIPLAIGHFYALFYTEEDNEISKFGYKPWLMLVLFFVCLYIKIIFVIGFNLVESKKRLLVYYIEVLNRCTSSKTCF